MALVKDTDASSAEGAGSGSGALGVAATGVILAGLCAPLAAAKRKVLGCLPALRAHWDGDSDPWQRMFQLAVANRAAGDTDLIPYWLFEKDDGVAIERIIPMLPMRKEVARFERLKKMLALYRLAFGQPRQEDLLAYLAEKGADPQVMEGLRIDLRPMP